MPVGGHALLLTCLALCACAATAKPGALPAPPVPALTLDSSLDASSAVLDTLPAPAAQGAAPQVGSQLGWAAGRALSVTELLQEWHATDPNSLWLVLEKLVTARLADAEASRISLRLAPEAVALRLEEEQARLRELLDREGLSLSSYARDEYGQSPEVFVEALRQAVLRQMLIERVTRAWVFSNDWLRLRMLVVQSADEMSALRARLLAGEDFASLAEQHSQDGSAPQGGLLAFLVREEQSPLSRHAFAQGVGELGEPFLHKGLQVMVRVEERHGARMQDDWAKLGADVEASLREFAITDSEFGHWKVSMEQRYPIDVEPLLELLGVESSGH